MTKYIIIVLLSFINVVKAQNQKPIETLKGYAYENKASFNKSFNGNFSYNINLFTIKTGDIELPINLTYNEDGVNLDKISENYGMNWNLDFGGQVTREIIDLEDHQISFNYGGKGNSPDHVYPVEMGFLKNINDNPDLMSGYRRDNRNLENIDLSPDIFTVNLLGDSHRFYINRNDDKYSPFFLKDNTISTEIVSHDLLNHTKDNPDFLYGYNYSIDFLVDNYNYSILERVTKKKNNSAKDYQSFKFVSS